MVYAAPFVKMTLSGTTCDENEIFNTGLHIIAEPEGVGPTGLFNFIKENADDLAAVWVNNWDVGALKIPYDAFLTQVKFALIGTDGLYVEEAYEVEVNQFGSYNGPYSPQDARVVTFDSGKRKDPGKYNRMYIPSGGNTEANAYQLTPAEQLAYGNAFANIIDELNTILAEFSEDFSASVGVVSSNGAGHQNRALRLRIGSLVDTQRRRRNKLPENYVNVNLEV